MKLGVKVLYKMLLNRREFSGIGSVTVIHCLRYKQHFSPHLPHLLAILGVIYYGGSPLNAIEHDIFKVQSILVKSEQYVKEDIIDSVVCQ
jgi:hypothetical protein